LYLYRYFNKYAISGKDVNFDPTKISMWSRNWYPFRSTWVYLRFLVGFLLFNLSFSVECFVNKCLSCLFWLLYCLSLAPCKAFNISSAWCHLNLYLYRYFNKYAISGKDVNFDPTKISMKSWKIPKG
jgi:hypothetical protein